MIKKAAVQCCWGREREREKRMREASECCNPPPFNTYPQCTEPTLTLHLLSFPPFFFSLPFSCAFIQEFLPPNYNKILQLHTLYIYCLPGVKSIYFAVRKYIIIPTVARHNSLSSVEKIPLIVCGLVLV